MKFIPDSTDLRGLHSDASILLVSGAVGVGKSSFVLMKCIMFAATRMLPIDGVRRCRVLVARTDMPKLEVSTLSVLQQWFGSSVTFRGSYPKFSDLIVGNADGTTSHIEFVLKGFADNEQEIYDNMSGTPTNILWVNEVQTYSTPAIIEIGYQRAGRHLDKAQGNQGYGLVIADFNPPPESHWLYEWEHNPPDQVKEVLKIEGFDLNSLPHKFTVEFLRYPSPVLPVVDEEGVTTGYRVNPEADYFYKQPAGFAYWARILQANSKNPNYIRTNILGEYGFRSDGIPVYMNVYNERLHVSSVKHDVDPNQTVYIGCDPSGFRGAAVVFQVTSRGFRIFKEFANPDEQLSFNEILNDMITPWIREHGIPSQNVFFVLDPANKQNDAKMTPRDECKAAGYDAVNAPTNDPDARIEALRYFLLKHGGIEINPGEDTVYLRRGLQADYYWKKQGSNIAGKKPRPEKTKPFSDICESLCYGCLYFRRGASTQDSVSAGTEFMLDGLMTTNEAEIV